MTLYSPNAFHRLRTPTYFGAPPTNFNYANNATSGTPAPYDGPMPDGPNAGTLFLGFGENATTKSFNRGLKALFDNTDMIDDTLRRDFAVPQISIGTAGLGGAATLQIPGPIWVGDSTVDSSIAGLRQILALCDPLDNEIYVGGVECQITAVDTTVGAYWSTAGQAVITLTINPPLPQGQAYRLHYYKRGRLADIDQASFTNLRQFSRYHGGTNWVDGTPNPVTTVSAQLDKIISDLVAVAGSARIGADAIAGTPYSSNAGSISSQITDAFTALNSMYALEQADIATEAAARAALDADLRPQIFVQSGFRLTVLSGNPVGETASTAYSNLYLTPYTSGYIRLFDGTQWRVHTSTEVTLSLQAGGTVGGGSGIYDVFAYFDGTAVQLEINGWGGSARGTALDRQDGILVKGGDATRLYVGTVLLHYVGGNVAVVNDTTSERSVWNYYNRVRRILCYLAPTTPAGATTQWSWNPAGTWRPFNNSSLARVSIVFGEDTYVEARCRLNVDSGGADDNAGVGIGVDNNAAPYTGTNAAQFFGTSMPGPNTKADAYHQDFYATVTSEFYGTIPVGFHYIYCLETGASGTFKVNNFNRQTGMILTYQG